MKRAPGMFQKRLFAKFELDIYLKNVMTRSLEFIHEYGTETSIYDMIDNLVERIDLTSLSLQAEQRVERIIPGHGGRFVEYRVAILALHWQP
ncbi:hypothetical protein ACFO0A_13955 [Novosphingobium tardum]|uniref:Uncharacterized protein n=1 Tax=Novosphingobium tardum TaxID=1538021 RepID=A0ABV8RRY5_9SPHN